MNKTRLRSGKYLTGILSAALILSAITAVLALPVSPKDAQPAFDVVTINAVITPPIAQYIEKSISEAKTSGSNGLIILLDTPGGLDLAMRDIVKAIMNASIPVIVYVSPSGARAASAGAIITIAAHVAAMAPGTNIGAAHPVSVGIGKIDDTMAKKIENDAVAYGIGIAQQRNRNVKWIERAIKKSESVPADEALREHVIDFVASDIQNLLAQMEGHRVLLSSGEVTLKTANATLRYKKMGLRESVLKAISDPNIAYILFLLGLAGLYFEFAHPGAVIPGIVGGISLIMAFFALQTLSVNFAGVLLILFAIILFVAEIKVMSHGVSPWEGLFP